MMAVLKSPLQTKIWLETVNLMNQKQTVHFDAIVIGSGMSGGWAAKELCEKGLKTLVLERGRNVEHIKDYTTTNMAPWEFDFRKRLTKETRAEYPIQKLKYCFDESTKQFFASDKKHPYTTPKDKPFRLYRGFQAGGKSFLWARQTYRWSDIDFGANAKDGHGVDWPVRYKDIAPWYDYVESYIGVSGQAEGLKQLPDGKFLPPMDLNCVEKSLRDSIAEQFDDRIITIGRAAHLTTRHNERGPCQYRNMCETGCPYGAYFNSVSVTLPAAQATGNMTFRPNAIVHSIIYDEHEHKATGVRVIDSETKETTEYFANIVFLCASALSSTRIMLNSKSEYFPNGIANSSGVLGHYLMDHFGYGFSASVDGYETGYYDGHRPNGFYIPRFQNVDQKEPDFVRGFGFQGQAYRENWGRGTAMDGLGADFKEEMMRPGPWRIGMGSFGECLPYYDNFVTLDEEVKDEWGMPVLHISGELKHNEKIMMQKMAESATAIFEAAGFKDIEIGDPDSYVLGHKSHEMGTARMGNDPQTSVLNKWNQCHDVPNLFVTDGSFMASSATQNPSLTYMAFTARAVNYAVAELKTGRL
jgi:choline dehydrogenase-like flavoprotein